MRNEVRTAANKPACGSTGEFGVYYRRVISTYKRRDTIHIICQALEPGFVVNLSFFAIKSPEGIGSIIKILTLAASLWK